MARPSRSWPNAIGGFVRLATIACALLLFAAIGNLPTADALAQTPADALYAASFKDLTDTPKPLAELKGKVAVVYFWATWCAPCHAETPKLVKLYETHRGRDVVVLGIALDNADKVRDFAKRYGVTYPVVYGGTDAIKLGRALGNDLGAIPFTVVIDRSGKIIETIKGDTPDGKLEAVLAPLLG